MTFFDWQTASNRTVSKSLWVYFAVAIPITVAVLAAWVLLTKKNREENSGMVRADLSGLVKRRTMEHDHDLEKND
jgi:hypothetical protein